MKIDDLLITAAQCREGRALLGISENDFAKEVGYAPSVIAEFEGGVNHPCVYMIRRAFERLGVEFENDGSVRLFDDGRVSMIYSDHQKWKERDEWFEALREWQVRVGVRARQALGDFSGKATHGPGAGAAFEEFPATP